MRTFIFTYNRYDSITSSMMWEEAGLDHTVLCHTDEAAEQFTAHGRVNPDRLHVTGAPKGLANNRNAALDMMDDGEWALFLVDDLKTLTEVADYDTRPTPPDHSAPSNNASHRNSPKPNTSSPPTPASSATKRKPDGPTEATLSSAAPSKTPTAAPSKPLFFKPQPNPEPC
jgi:hypothetical protein